MVPGPEDGVEVFVEAFLGLVARVGDDAKGEGAATLCALCGDDDIVCALASGGAIERLVALVSDGAEHVRSRAAFALRALARSEDRRVAIGRAGGVAALTACLVQHAQPTGAATEDAGREAAFALSLLSEAAECRALLVDCGTAAPLVDLVASATGGAHGPDAGTLGAAAAAASALGTLATDGASLRALPASGAAEPLVRLLVDGVDGTAGFAAGHLELVTEAVARFAAVTALRAPLVSAGAVAPLVKLVRSSHAGRRLHASQALAHLAESSADARAAISALGCVAPLLELSNRGALACRRALLSLMAEPTARAEIEAAGGVPRAESEGVWV